MRADDGAPEEGGCTDKLWLEPVKKHIKVINSTRAREKELQSNKHLGSTKKETFGGGACPEDECQQCKT